MTHDEIEAAYRRLICVGWPNETGPWVDAMDLELRTKFPADHQLLIVGFGLGRSHDPPRPGHPTDGPDHAAWRTLLVSVVKRTRVEAARIDLGYGRPLRPSSVVPGYAGESRQSRKRR